ncbi:MAG: hypothetical protein JWO12_935 [Frankiales bacterium]|jgi:hypothetical protein|nr:hypothetical protein [Frankiales bacterium]
MPLATEYAFVLPRGYVDRHGDVHRTGIMRLATARDELEPLRDPTVSGPDDPRLTVLVLARVVSTLGSLELVTPHEIEGLFTADMAFLQDFYGVINFGTQEEYEALLAEQEQAPPPPTPVGAAPQALPAAAPAAVPTAAPDADSPPAPANRRAQIEEMGAVRR